MNIPKILLIFSLLVAFPGFADEPQDQQLNQKILNLKQALSKAIDKQSLLNRELAANEKQLSKGLQNLQQLKKDINAKRADIAKYRQTTRLLNNDLVKQQQILAKYLLVRFKMGQYSAIKWVLNQDNLCNINHMLTYQYYLMRHQAEILTKVEANKRYFGQQQATLTLEMAHLTSLESTLNHHQAELTRNQTYHRAVIYALHQDIQSKEQTLSHLLRTLSSQSNPHPNRAFANMRHKLPKPIRNMLGPARNRNQGLIFAAAEGAPIYAVFPGKIVFSDWLNGYGLLLIVDHGQGYMTLYAHNQSLIKHKGDHVLQGEKLATVGHSGELKQSALYFEVRQNGKAVSPLQWLV